MGVLFRLLERMCMSHSYIARGVAARQSPIDPLRTTAVLAEDGAPHEPRLADDRMLAGAQTLHSSCDAKTGDRLTKGEIRNAQSRAPTQGQRGKGIGAR